MDKETLIAKARALESLDDLFPDFVTQKSAILYCID